MKAVSPFDDLCPGYNPTVTCYCSFVCFKNELLLSSRFEDLMIDGEDLLIVMEYLLGSSNAINQYKRPIFFKFCASCTAQNLKNIRLRVHFSILSALLASRRKKEWKWRDFVKLEQLFLDGDGEDQNLGSSH
mmetsp:Transcript_17704/g.23324  ORF Transcript_17704/g.23324 Transcript_17704/m.23324 type:complete len:132 (+) Transcript_17704:518-913(+)